MKYDELVRSVAEGTELTRREADEVILATLTTLSEHISPEETRDLLAQLPKSFKERVPVTSERTIMQPAEFVLRTADRLETIPIEAVEGHVRIVFATLADAVNAGEMRDIFEQLGDDYADLLDRRPLGAPPEPAGSGSVLDRTLHLGRNLVDTGAGLGLTAARTGIDVARHAAGAITRAVGQRRLSRSTPS